MSFYGNVTYYLSNAFKQIIYENTSTDSTTVPTTNSADHAQYQMTPQSQYDSTKLMAGNTWVRFGGDQSDTESNQCYIFHKLTGLGQKTLSVTTLSSGEPDKVLAFDSIFTIPTITFDEAGHLLSGSEVKVKLPANPGVEDIDNLKRRIATLEEMLTGDHGDSGSGSDSGGEGDEGGSDDIPDVTNPTNLVIADIQKKINDWNMYESTGEPYWRYKEGNGIGTTLHDVMTKIGLRKKVTYNDPTTGESINGYQEIDSANLMTEAPDSILGKVTTATALANSVTVVSTQTRNGIRDLLDYLVNTGALGDSDRTFLIDTYFYATNGT